MSLSKQFNRTLDKLWYRRTAELRALVVAPGKGPPLKFTKKIRQRYTDDLLELATRIIMVRGEGKRAFDGVVAYRKLRQIRPMAIFMPGCMRRT